MRGAVHFHASRRRPWWGAAVVLLMLAAAYLPAMRGGYIWDDDAYVTDNACLKNLAGLRRIWTEIGATPQYYPLVHTTFWVEHQLWGLRPLGYHVTNVMLHALTALLLWRILRRLDVPGAGLAAAIFALHPVHVESVAWITERKNTLSGLLYMLALWSYLRFTPLVEPSDADEGSRVQLRHRWRFYVLALLFFVGALLSKTVTCTLPAVIVVILWWRRSTIGLRDWLALLPMASIGAGMGLLTAWMEKHVVGADGTEWGFTVLERSVIAGRALWFYVGKLVWPASLTFIYPRWTIDASQWWQIAQPVAAVAVIIALWLLRRRIGKGPLAAVLIFAGTLMPALGFIDVYPMRYSFVADHFQYLASVSMIVLLAAIVATVARRFADGSHRMIILNAARAGQIALVCALAMLVYRQSHAYHDVETLWRDTIAKNPNCFMARSNLAVLLMDRGEFDEAITHLQHALATRPGDIDLQCNLGTAYERMGRFEEALTWFRQAADARPNDPRLRRNLGVTLAKLGRTDEAIEQFSVAVSIWPDDVNSQQNLAELLLATGQIQRAIHHYERVVRHQPERLGPVNNLAWLLATQPDVTGREARRAIELAERMCRQTDHQVPLLLDTLAAAYATAGRYGDAAEVARKAHRLAESSRQEKLADRIQSRLALYQSRERYTRTERGS